MQEYQLDFITYCVGNLADRLKMSASQIIWFRHGQGSHRVDFMDYPISDNTMTLTAGDDLYTTSRLLEHTNIHSTEIYADVVMERRTQAVNLLNAIFWFSKEVFIVQTAIIGLRMDTSFPLFWE